jgi:CRISPR-associated protein Cmr4
MSNVTQCKEIFSIATDPIYIGTGGYTIGRVDNTIVRDPITKIPKIPGSSLAGTWRYYVAMELQAAFKDEYKKDLSKREEKRDNVKELFNKSKEWMNNFDGNRFARIKCAGQDEEPQKSIEESKNINTGHCGHCIVCKSFGYSKNNKSWQGMLFFSDLNILFFPVYTRIGVRWISSPKILKEALNIDISISGEDKIKTSEGNEKNLNLGWLNLEVENKHNINDDKLNKDGLKKEIKQEDIIVVPDSLISQIINSNLEVRTSVSIDPITGAAKEKALFTSEAVPRGTVFYGEIRLFDKNSLGESNLPSKECIWQALDDTKKYYETLGIGGMTTRGFGRMKMLTEIKGGECKADNPNGGSSNDTTGN